MIPVRKIEKKLQTDEELLLAYKESGEQELLARLYLRYSDLVYGTCFKYLKDAFQRKTMVKNILLDQNVIRGIGNGYSDEVLWETRISPYSIAEAIPDAKIKELVTTIKKVLKTETERIYKKYPGLVNGEIKEFLKIHSREKTHSPTGALIKIDTKGARKTYYTDEQVLYK